MKTIKAFLIIFGLVTAISKPSLAIEYFLRADVTTKTMPDGNVITMWGFALDSAFGAMDGNVTVPGPLLRVPPNDPCLVIHLDNNLDVPVSIIINGQITAMAPVRLPEDINRVRSFTHETEPGNIDPCDYVWSNFHEGTYIYSSGTHIAVQVPMGLYGGIVKDLDDGEAYDGVPYDIEIPLFFSEIDPVLNKAVATNNFGPGLAMTSTIDYEPKYFLINGESFGPNSVPMAAGNAGDILLVRFFNMGLKTRCPLLQGGYMTLIAEDGQPYRYPKQQYVALLAAGKTIDALITFQQDDAYPIYDRRLGLTTSQITRGGMLTYLSVGGVLPPNLAPIISSATATPSIIESTQTSQLQVVASDIDGPSPLNYNWIVPAGAGNISNTSIANPVYTPPLTVGTQVFTLTVEVSDGLNTVSRNVNITVVTPTVPVINSVTATPASIFDNQTSQLTVVAVDADGGYPAPLSYNWIIPAGAGSVSNAAIANPIYTPPDITSNTSRTFTLTVRVSDGANTVSSPVNIVVTNALIFSSNFNSNTGSFAYRDNTFRDTTTSTYANGSRVTGGITGRALQVFLGGRNNNEIRGMSGGWRRTINLATATNVKLTFMYKLTQSPNYENDEFSEILLSIDGTLIGTGANDYIARITGDGDGGIDITTDWQPFELNLSLAAGSHTIIIGGYNNKKTDTNEFTTIMIDDAALVRI